MTRLAILSDLTPNRATVDLLDPTIEDVTNADSPDIAVTIVPHDTTLNQRVWLDNVTILSDPFAHMNS